MPTYKSTGIGASLVVTELAGTLCDEIQLRMGADQREEAERIKLQLLNGRILQERPFDQDHSTVGILQFLGDERDMALFAVEVGDSTQVQDETGDHSLANVETPPVVTTAFISHSFTNPGMTSTIEPAHVDASRKRKRKKTSNNERSGNHDQTLLTASTPKPKQSERRTITFDEPLALSLKVDCEDFINSDDMHGKDLKIEVFLNGQLVDVTFENHRQTKSKGNYLYSGKRFHRQAEKPWVYVPGTASSNTGGLATERWANIGRNLEEEASQRGVDQKRQRPLSAQFLIALSRLRLPDSVSARSENFAVIDVVITAGRGRKHGAETSYITAPTRLFDGNFKGVVPVEEDFGQHPDPYEYRRMHEDFVHTPFGYPAFSNFQTSSFIDTQTPPSALLDFQYPVFAEHPMTPSPSTHTPKPETKSLKTYRKVLEAAPIKKLLSKCENARGHVKGRRTLKQRIGDMSKMSPRKRLEVMNELKKEVDENTVDTIKKAFEIDCLDPTMPSKKMQCSSDVSDLRPVTDGDDAEIIFGQPTNKVNAVNPHRFVYDLPPPQPQVPTYGFSQMPHFLPEIESFQPTMVPPSPAQWFAQTQQTMMPPSPTQMLPLYQQTAMQPSPTQRSIPPSTPPKATPASALSNSPIRLPVKKWPSQLRREALAAPADDKDDEQRPAFPPSGAATTPQAQRVGYGSKRSSSAWLPNEQKHDQALKGFQIPDLCVGSAVSYADGLQQRQVSKARGGEFVEQQFVVGIRFVVF